MERIRDSELGIIMEKVSKLEDRRSCSEVCKQWYRVEAQTRRSLRIINHLHHLYNILPRFPNIISFASSKKLSDSHLEFLSKTYPNLQHLWLRFIASLAQVLDDFGDNEVQAIATGCPNLTHGDLSARTGVTDIGLITLVQSCRKLVYLDLEGCLRVGDQSLKAIGALKLHRLNLRGCSRITDLGLAALAKGSAARTLRVLDLSRCPKMTDHGVLFLKEMRCLVGLSLAYCGPKITDVGGVAVSAIHTLEKLSFCNLKNITDVTLVAVSRNCLNLDYVNVYGCESITKEGMDCFRPEVIHLSFTFFGTGAKGNASNIERSCIY